MRDTVSEDFCQAQNYRNIFHHAVEIAIMCSVYGTRFSFQ